MQKCRVFLFNVHVFKCISALFLSVCLRVWKGGSKCLLIVGQVSHLDASSCDGNRNGQKSEADTANGSLKLGGMVTSVALFLTRSMCGSQICSNFSSLTVFHTLFFWFPHCVLPSFSPQKRGLKCFTLQTKTQHIDQ